MNWTRAQRYLLQRAITFLADCETLRGNELRSTTEYLCGDSHWLLHAVCVTFTILLQYTEPMPKTKIATLNLRIDPGVKEAVREAADREHRSVANMIEMLIRRHCDVLGIIVPEQSAMFPGKQNG